MKIEIIETEKGFYVTGKNKGVKYGQGYATTDKRQAEVWFRELVWTYENKGDLFVMTYGATRVGGN
jgi:hypothetical protein